MFVPLTCEQIDEIKQAATLIGEDGESFDVDYDEVLEQFAESFLYAQGMCNDLVPVHIDLEHPYYLYGVDVAVFRNDIKDEPEIIQRHVELNDEEYIWLVNHYMIYPETSFNEIRTINSKLFNKMCGFIESNIEKRVSQLSKPTYAVDLTQIKEDAAELKTLINELRVNL